jgi:hypothetical protein
MPVKKKSVEQSAYQLKVTLRDIRPPMRRRIPVTSNITLFDFHWFLQTAMRWYGGHLHEFDVFGNPYGDAQGMRSEVLDERKVILGQLITAEKETFHYLYDFGDS